MALARRTGASTIVRGTIGRLGDTLSVHVRLVSASDGKVLIDASPVSGSMSAPGLVIETARQRVMGAFAGLADDRFRAWERVISHPPRYDAYQEFVAGLQGVDRTAPPLPQDPIDHGHLAFMHFVNAARLDTTFLQAKFWAVATDDGSAGPQFTDSMLAVANKQRDRLTEYDRAALDFQLAERAVDQDGMYLAARRMSAAAPWDWQAVIAHAASATQTNRYDDAIRVLATIDPARQPLVDEGGYFSWVMRAYHMRGDYETQLKEARRLTALVSSRAAMCGRGLGALAAMGNEPGVDSLIAACLSKPANPGRGVLYFNAGMEYWVHGHGDAANRAFEISKPWYLSLRPPREDAVRIIDWFRGDWTAVDDFWRRHPPADSSALPTAYGQIGVAAVHLGDRAKADSMLRRLAALDRRGVPANGRVLRALLARAMILAALGEEVPALHLVRQAVDRGLAPVTLHYTLPEYERGLEPLRTNPEFQALFKPRR
jgi:hypothetical protein